MLCKECRSVIGSVDLEVSNGVFQIGPQISRDDERNLAQIRTSNIAGCCICRRLACLFEQGSNILDDLTQILLRYRVTDFKGYYRVTVYTQVKYPTDQSIYDGSFFDFEFLPGQTTDPTKSSYYDSGEATPTDRTKKNIKSRMSACRNDHPECRRGNWWRPEVVGIKQVQHWRPEAVEDAWLPTRLLQITDVDDQDPVVVRVVETAEMQRGPYAALSHCWGGMSTHKLERSTRDQFTAGIDCLSLPKTFREAIQVAIWPGINYIWIDSLCIC